jgi:hypothetical protein
MYHDYDFQDLGDYCKVVAFVEDEPVFALKTHKLGDESEDIVALSHAVRDEFGCPNALYEAGDIFEIVAVPDDVAVASPPPGAGEDPEQAVIRKWLRKIASGE